MVLNQVITWYLKLISCKSASEELEEEQSIQNRGDTDQRDHMWSFGGEKLWVLLLASQQCGLSTWPPDEGPSVSQLFGR